MAMVERGADVDRVEWKRQNVKAVDLYGHVPRSFWKIERLKSQLSVSKPLNLTILSVVMYRL